MSIHQLFAHNLRTGCLKFSSIAEACRTIGVNRQQFNKYLQGAMLPNARTLHRICNALGLEEWQLFLPQQMKTAEDAEPLSDLISPVEAILTLMASNRSISKLLSANKDAGLKPGSYTCYFPLLGVNDCLVPSTMQISAHQGLLTFTRHTRVSSPSTKNKFLATGKHHGIILSNGAYDYLIGTNTVSPYNITFMCFPRDVTGGESIQVGLAIIQSLSPLVACKVALKAIPPSALNAKRALLENSKLLLAKTDPEKTMAKTLHSSDHQQSAILTLLDLNMLSFGAGEIRQMAT